MCRNWSSSRPLTISREKIVEPLNPDFPCDAMVEKWTVMKSPFSQQGGSMPIQFRNPSHLLIALAVARLFALPAFGQTPDYWLSPSRNRQGQDSHAEFQSMPSFGHFRHKSLFPVIEPVQQNFRSTFTEPMFEIHKFASPHALGSGERSIAISPLEYKTT
jgi:hypothetical protein